MHPWLLCILICLPVFSAGDKKVAGIPPALVHRYVPLTGGTWRCLDDSAEIWWSEVNNDYCDCADGSDEPGLP
jgi:protein kinase C substrate 80K-H